MAKNISGRLIDELKEVVIGFLRDDNVKVILFGSRARNDYNTGSDIDIGLIPDSVLDRNKITLLREKIEKLNIPYKVEIIDFSKTSESFQKEALKEVVVWKD